MFVSSLYVSVLVLHSFLFQLCSVLDQVICSFLSLVYACAVHEPVTSRLPVHRLFTLFVWFYTKLCEGGSAGIETRKSCIFSQIRLDTQFSARTLSSCNVISNYYQLRTN